MHEDVHPLPVYIFCVCVWMLSCRQSDEWGGQLKALTLFVFLILAVLFSAANATGFTFNDPLVDAADRGDKARVVELLKRGYPVDSEGDFRVTALMRAAFRGDSELVSLLVEVGAYINAADLGGATPLHLAARNGNVEAVRQLVDAGAAIDIPDKEKWTPLMRATMAKQTEVVKILIENGADVLRVNEFDESVLLHAAMVGVPEIMSVVIGSEGFVDMSADQSEVALSIMQKKGYTVAENILLDAIRSRDAGSHVVSNGFGNAVSSGDGLTDADSLVLNALAGEGLVFDEKAAGFSGNVPPAMAGDAIPHSKEKTDEKIATTSQQGWMSSAPAESAKPSFFSSLIEKMLWKKNAQVNEGNRTVPPSSHPVEENVVASAVAPQRIEQELPWKAAADYSYSPPPLPNLLSFAGEPVVTSAAEPAVEPQPEPMNHKVTGEQDIAMPPPMREYVQSTVVEEPAAQEESVAKSAESVLTEVSVADAALKPSGDVSLKGSEMAPVDIHSPPSPPDPVFRSQYESLHEVAQSGEVEDMPWKVAGPEAESASEPDLVENTVLPPASLLPVPVFKARSEEAPKAKEEKLPEQVAESVEKKEDGLQTTDSLYDYADIQWPAVTSEAVEKKLASQAMSAGTTFMMQMGAFVSEDQALTVWHNLQQGNSDVLSGLEPRVVKALLVQDDAVVYRLRVGYFNDKKDAQRVCDILRKRNVECFLVETSAAAKNAQPAQEIRKNQYDADVDPYVARQLEEAGLYPDASDITPFASPLPMIPVQQEVAMADSRAAPLSLSSHSLPPVASPEMLPEDLIAPEAEVATYEPLAAPIVAPLTEAVDEELPWQVLENESQSEEILPWHRQQVIEATSPVEQLPAQAPLQKLHGNHEGNVSASVGGQMVPFTLHGQQKTLTPERDTEEQWEKVSREVRNRTRQEFFAAQGIKTPPQVADRDYGDFYREMEGKLAKKSTQYSGAVSEAILVPDETYFTSPNAMSGYGAETTPSPVAQPKGRWAIISGFKNEKQARDYWLRMFQYDESFRHLQMAVVAPDVPSANAGAVIKVVQFAPGEGMTVCDIVTKSGYGCVLKGEEVSDVAAARKPVTSPDWGKDTVDVVRNEFWIELGTFSSATESEYYWMFLLEDHGDVLNDLKYDMAKAEEHGEFGPEAVKLRVGPFGNNGRATQVCEILRYRNVACLVEK